MVSTFIFSVTPTDFFIDDLKLEINITDKCLLATFRTYPFTAVEFLTLFPCCQMYTVVCCFHIISFIVFTAFMRTLVERRERLTTC